jgi:hypothetical protein
MAAKPKIRGALAGDKKCIEPIKKRLQAPEKGVYRKRCGKSDVSL